MGDKSCGGAGLHQSVFADSADIPLDAAHFPDKWFRISVSACQYLTRERHGSWGYLRCNANRIRELIYPQNILMYLVYCDINVRLTMAPKANITDKTSRTKAVTLTYGKKATGTFSKRTGPNGTNMPLDDLDGYYTLDKFSTYYIRIINAGLKNIR